MAVVSERENPAQNIACKRLRLADILERSDHAAAALPSPSADSDTRPADLLVIAGRAIVDGTERPAAVEVRSGRIAAIHDLPGDLPVARETVALADDEVLLPALVDTHVHANEPGRTHWEGLATLTRAAAAGGIGTVVDMPLNSIPATVDRWSVAEKMRSCVRPQIDVGMWGGAVGGRLRNLPDLIDAGVLGAKAFMLDSGVAEFPALATDEGLVTAMTIMAELDRPLLVHAEDAATAARAPQPIGTQR
ncbi:MAG: amidohydrolase family protein, partial [Patulibacter sp.]